MDNSWWAKLICWHYISYMCPHAPEPQQYFHDNDQIPCARLNAPTTNLAVTWPDLPCARRDTTHGSRPAAALRNDSSKMEVNINFLNVRKRSCRLPAALQRDSLLIVNVLIVDIEI